MCGTPGGINICPRHVIIRREQSQDTLFQGLRAIHLPITDLFRKVIERFAHGNIFALAGLRQVRRISRRNQQENQHRKIFDS